MKKTLALFVSAVMILVSGCSNTSEPVNGTVEEDHSVNMFNDENAVTVVSGNLSYSIPGSVADQYDEKYKDIGFELPFLQTYKIPSFGELTIYSANLFYNEDVYATLGDMGNAYLELTINRTEMRNIVSDIFSKDKYNEISRIHGAVVDGYDTYMCTEQSDIDIDIRMSEDGTSSLEEEEIRITYFIRTFSAYLIVFKVEKGCYNEQIYDTFIDSIELVSLEDY